MAKRQIPDEPPNPVLEPDAYKAWLEDWCKIERLKYRNKIRRAARAVGGKPLFKMEFAFRSSSIGSALPLVGLTKEGKRLEEAIRQFMGRGPIFRNCNQKGQIRYKYALQGSETEGEFKILAQDYLVEKGFNVIGLEQQEGNRSVCIRKHRWSKDGRGTAVEGITERRREKYMVIIVGATK